MKFSTPLLGALACGLLSSCLKDGVDAPSSTQEPTTLVRFDMHCNGRPFHADSSYRDGFGTLVRFEHFRLALIGAELLDDEGVQLSDRTATALIADLRSAEQTFPVPVSKSGEAHWLDTRTVTTQDRNNPSLEAFWIEAPDGPFLGLLDIGGVYDSNDDGRLDSTDQPFRIALAPDTNDPGLRIHAHSTVQAGAPSKMELSVNLCALLVDVDLPDAPLTMGHGAYASQVLHNLRTRVLGADNKPL